MEGSSLMLPLPMAWIVLEDGAEAFHAATCYYNGATDGGRVAPGSKEQQHASALMVGLPNGSFAEKLRSVGSCVVHVVTDRHGKIVADLLANHQGEATSASSLSLLPFSPDRGFSAPRVADAPVAFACKLEMDVPVADEGFTGYFLTIEAVFISGSVVTPKGMVDSQAVHSLGSLDFSGSKMLHAIEEHRMVFPSKCDDNGLWNLPPCTEVVQVPQDTEEVTKVEDIVYLSPLLPDLPFNPFKALIVPRPIGWISTSGEKGDNLSPYSFFGYISPSVVYFSAGGKHPHPTESGDKDALRDAKFSKCFCVNLVPWRLRLAMSASAAPAQSTVDEFELPIDPSSEGKIEEPVKKGRCEKINAPYVSNSPLRLECELLDLVTFHSQNVVIGRVVHIVGTVDGPVASRGGYMNYFRFGDEHIFRPLAQE